MEMSLAVADGLVKYYDKIYELLNFWSSVKITFCLCLSEIMAFVQELLKLMGMAGS